MKKITLNAYTGTELEDNFCKMCSDTCCNGVVEFLKEHVSGMTDCPEEKDYLNIIIEHFEDEA